MKGRLAGRVPILRYSATARNAALMKTIDVKDPPVTTQELFDLVEGDGLCVRASNGKSSSFGTLNRGRKIRISRKKSPLPGKIRNFELSLLNGLKKSQNIASKRCVPCT